MSNKVVPVTGYVKKGGKAVASHVCVLNTQTTSVSPTKKHLAPKFGQEKFVNPSGKKVLTTKRLEFLVVDGSLIVGDKEISERVHRGFDEKKHYVGAWQLQNVALLIGKKVQ
jgi:hypothetical protein